MQRIRLLNPLALALVLSTGAAPRPLRAQGASPCLRADDQTEFLSAVLTEFLTQTDATNVGLRQKLKLPQLAVNTISLVTDSRTCDKAIPALDAAQGRNVTRRIYLFKLGNSRFGVVEEVGPLVSGEYGGGATPVWYFDSTWNYVSTGLV